MKLTAKEEDILKDKTILVLDKIYKIGEEQIIKLIVCSETVVIGKYLAYQNVSKECKYFGYRSHHIREFNWLSMN